MKLVHSLPLKQVKTLLCVGIFGSVSEVFCSVDAVELFKNRHGDIG